MSRVSRVGNSSIKLDKFLPGNYDIRWGEKYKVQFWRMMRRQIFSSIFWEKMRRQIYRSFVTPLLFSRRKINFIQYKSTIISNTFNIACLFLLYKDACVRMYVCMARLSVHMYFASLKCPVSAPPLYLLVFPYICMYVAFLKCQMLPLQI